MLEEVCCRIHLRCCRCHNRLGLGCRCGLLLVYKNGRSYVVLVDGRADIDYTANIIRGNDGDGNFLGYVSVERFRLGKYGFFCSGSLGCCCRSISKSASLHVVLINVLLRANVTVSNVVVLGLVDKHINGRCLRSFSISHVGRSLAIDYKRILLKLGIRNILVYLIGKRLINLISIRICTAIDSLYGIGIGLGDDDTVKTVDLGYGLCIKKKRCSRLKSLKEYGVGRIPLCIVKILIELNRTVVLLPLLNLSVVLDLEVKDNSTDEECEEACNETEENVQHRIIPSAELGRLSLRKSGDRHSRQRRHCRQTCQNGLLVFVKDVHMISIHCLFTAYP